MFVDLQFKRCMSAWSKPLGWLISARIFATQCIHEVEGVRDQMNILSKGYIALYIKLTLQGSTYAAITELTTGPGSTHGFAEFLLAKIIGMHSMGSRVF